MIRSGGGEKCKIIKKCSGSAEFFWVGELLCVFYFEFCDICGVVTKVD